MGDSIEVSSDSKIINLSETRLKRFSLGEKLSKIIPFTQSQEPPIPADAHFDWRFYVEYYEDLRDLGYEAACEHWMIFGKSEGRLASQSALKQYLDIRKINLPEGFSAEQYLELNPDLNQRFGANQYKHYRAIEHYLEHGKEEGRPYQIHSGKSWQKTKLLPEKNSSSFSSGVETLNVSNTYDVVQVMERLFDEEWYVQQYKEVHSFLKNNPQQKPFNYYINWGIGYHHSPNPNFDEEWYLSYYQDIKAAVNSGRILCGFEHFLVTGRHEGRLPKPDLQATLEEKYPSITHPVGIGNIGELERKLKKIPVFVGPKQSKKINILIPLLDADVMFGGYISLFHFIRRLIEQAFEVRLIVCEDYNCNVDLIKLNLCSKPDILKAVEQCEIINASSRNQPITISKDDRFIAYDAWTAIQAAHMASLTSMKRFFFFIQEYESIFHHHSSTGAIVDSAYRLPHIALFNTKILASYFQSKRLGVFSDIFDCDFIAFEHALGKVNPPTTGDLEVRKSRSLLFYARPEAHAARNLFEIGILALRRAVEQDVFDQGWVFDGIGTLGSEYTLDLGKDHRINLCSKIPQQEYEKRLKGYDIGLSLMYAPHPSVLPFEMVKAGLIVITNTYENRDRASLLALSRNLVPCLPDIDSIVDALREAAIKSCDFTARVANAHLDWTNDWNDTFNSLFFERFRSLLRW